MKKVVNRKVICLLMVLLLSVGTASAFDVAPLAYQYFRTGHVSLSNAGNFLVLNGETIAKHDVVMVKIEMYLQQYKNGSWEDVYHYVKSGFDNSYVSGTATRVVPEGTYRIRGVHTVFHEGLTESTSSYTGPVDF